MTDGNGLIYMRARYYNPEVRRFVSQDSLEGDIVNPLTINLYSYCGNNPANRLDPSGNIYLIAWSYGSEVNSYKDEYGNIDFNRFTKESSFARAAYTRKQELMAAGVPESEVCLQRIDNMEDLKETWKMWASYTQVDGLDIFSHASNTSGLVTPDEEASTPFWMNENQKVLAWTGAAEVVFHGCYSAPYAQFFATHQKVTSYGQAEDAKFSENSYKRVRIKTGETTLNVYLFDYEYPGIIWRYNRDGKGIMYTP
jgi:RHS repeat-associated protein